MVETLPDGVAEVEVNGVTVTVDMRDLDSVDVLYQLKDAQNGDMFATLDIIDILIGEEQRNRLVATIRDPDTGRASVQDFVQLLEDLFAALPK